MILPLPIHPPAWDFLAFSMITHSALASCDCLWLSRAQYTFYLCPSAMYRTVFCLYSCVSLYVVPSLVYRYVRGSSPLLTIYTSHEIVTQP